MPARRSPAKRASPTTFSCREWPTASCCVLPILTRASEKSTHRAPPLTPEYGILPVSQDEQALCVDRVRHVGDPVAAVIAREELTAFEALDLIDVDYEILATISDPEEALATPEPRIHEYGEEGNIHKFVALEFGNVEEGFAEG